MAARRPASTTATPSKKSPTAGTATSVATFLAELTHPHKTGVERLRRAILAIDTRITEEVKWNAPSFKLTDHFATFKLHPPKHIQLVLHTGSKPIVPPRQFTLEAPEGLLKWAAPDRCVLTLQSSADAQDHEADVVAIVRQWLAQL
jgi:hypothetical protein